MMQSEAREARPAARKTVAHGGIAVAHVGTVGRPTGRPHASARKSECATRNPTKLVPTASSEKASSVRASGPAPACAPARGQGSGPAAGLWRGSGRVLAGFRQGSGRVQARLRQG